MKAYLKYNGSTHKWVVKISDINISFVHSQDAFDLIRAIKTVN